MRAFRVLVILIKLRVCRRLRPAGPDPHGTETPGKYGPHSAQRLENAAAQERRSPLSKPGVAADLSRNGCSASD
ncbi:hypothetical protein E2C01_096359 [Portunus trituberculatus]|uniref:Uncharacterized protein n=1 Tax=Portunus trituberculatus TaxID=210409 RepID=A0A5B7K813_PORTR|nr:hypothetical protein [Portunus trituberculatus]